MSTITVSTTTTLSTSVMVSVVTVAVTLIAQGSTTMYSSVTSAHRSTVPPVETAHSEYTTSFVTSESTLRSTSTACLSVQSTSQASVSCSHDAAEKRQTVIQTTGFKAGIGVTASAFVILIAAALYRLCIWGREEDDAADAQESLPTRSFTLLSTTPHHVTGQNIGTAAAPNSIATLSNQAGTSGIQEMASRSNDTLRSGHTNLPNVIELELPDLPDLPPEYASTASRDINARQPPYPRIISPLASAETGRRRPPGGIARTSPNSGAGGSRYSFDSPREGSRAAMHSPPYPSEAVPRRAVPFRGFPQTPDDVGRAS